MIFHPLSSPLTSLTSSMFRSAQATQQKSKSMWHPCFEYSRCRALWDIIVVSLKNTTSTGSNFLSRIARMAGLQVLRAGGVVRGFTNWGPFRLPRPVTKHQAKHSIGHHFIMRFDSSSPVQAEIRRSLGLDPRMIRFAVVKLGSTLEDIKDVPGKVEWNDFRPTEERINLQNSNATHRT